LGGTPVTPSEMPIWQVIFLTFGKVALFVAVMLVVGPLLFPWLLRVVVGTGSQELFTLVVVVLSLGVAYGSAWLFGVSFALGAFFAGIVIHETPFGKKAERELRPLQHVFSALFFVSVGMLFDPQVVTQNPGKLLLVIGIIVIGKSVAALAIVLLLRRTLRTALTVSVALAQIGEFSFILAALGLSLKLIPPETQSLIVAGALFSITLNPALFALLRRAGMISAH
jgi:CPA2 family monovalent cation:H+ antiporter-2